MQQVGCPYTRTRMGRRLLLVDTPESPESPRSKRQCLNRRRAQNLRARRASSLIDTATIALREQAAAGKLPWADNYCPIFIYTLYLYVYLSYLVEL